MDYTIAQYKQPAFDKLAFDGAKEKLVKKLGYPEKLLDVEYDHTVSKTIFRPFMHLLSFFLNSNYFLIRHIQQLHSSGYEDSLSIHREETLSKLIGTSTQELHIMDLHQCLHEQEKMSTLDSSIKFHLSARSNM